MPGPKRHDERLQHCIKEFVIGLTDDATTHSPLVMIAPNFRLDPPQDPKVFDALMHSFGATPLADVGELATLPLQKGWQMSIDRRGIKTLLYDGGVFYRSRFPACQAFLTAAADRGFVLLYFVADAPEDPEIRAPFLFAQTEADKGFMIRMRCDLFPGSPAQT